MHIYGLIPYGLFPLIPYGLIPYGHTHLYPALKSCCEQLLVQTPLPSPARGVQAHMKHTITQSQPLSHTLSHTITATQSQSQSHSHNHTLSYLTQSESHSHNHSHTITITYSQSQTHSCTITLHSLHLGNKAEFRLATPEYTTVQGLPYDYDSIMHYETTAFSFTGQPTIQPLNVSVSSDRLGQRENFSPIDLQHLAIMYCNGMLVDWGRGQGWSARMGKNMYEL